MTLDDYLEFTLSTAIYPGAGTGDPEETVYLSLGLCGEIGELAEKLKKNLRDGTLIEAETIAKELGDVLWYWTRLCQVVKLEPSFLAKFNKTAILRRGTPGEELLLVAKHAGALVGFLQDNHSNPQLPHHFSALYQHLEVLAQTWNFPMVQIMHMNVTKLRDRKARSMIRGSGDER